VKLAELVEAQNHEYFSNKKKWQETCEKLGAKVEWEDEGGASASFGPGHKIAGEWHPVSQNGVIYRDNVEAFKKSKDGTA